MKILPLNTEHVPQICAFLTNLSEWFNADAQVHIPLDLQHQQGFVVIENEKVVAFVSYVIWEGALNICWLGSEKECQGKGYGTALIKQVEAKARELNIPELRTWTLGEGVDSKPYELTRQFYYKNGFVVFQRSQTDNPGCPEEIKLKKIL